MDYLDASLTIEAKSFKAEVNIIRNRYLRGNPDGWNATYIAGEIIKTYNNMFEDGRCGAREGGPIRGRLYVPLLKLYVCPY